MTGSAGAPGPGDASGPTGASGWAPSAIELERRSIRRRQSIRSILIAVGSTVVLAVLLWFLVLDTPGARDVQQTFFSPSSAVEALPRVWDGFLTNLRILVVASISVAIVATVIAALRTLTSPVLFPLRALATGYTDLFRATPLIIVIYLVGFGVPGLVRMRIPAETLGTVAIVVVYSAYVAEVLRAGIEAVNPAQRMAARSLGLSGGQTLRTVLLPQALRNVTPALMNDFVAMQKDVGLVSILGAVDAVRAAGIETAQLFDYTPYVVAGVLFVLLGIPCIRFVDWWTARLRSRERIGVIV